MKKYKINLNDVKMSIDDVVNVTVKSTDNNGNFINKKLENLKFLGHQQITEYTSPFFVFIESGEKPLLRMINPHDIREISFSLNVLDLSEKTVIQ